MPGLPVVFHPEAVEESRTARLWYAERNQSAADSFLAELDHGIESISEAPERWPLFIHDTRRYLFLRFPFQIVYRVANDRIEVVAIAHGRRRPWYWRLR
ncbi:MAG: type II toxin-antitoxin system RelE/ParE family toxin [Nitrospira sp.]|nr:type II toxin-antitoxin system RelE/ParE family toxin [Nitrospira sp.]